jgi:hypothetical protein
MSSDPVSVTVNAAASAERGPPPLLGEPSEDAARIGLGARGVWNSATCAASGMRFPSPFEEG